MKLHTLYPAELRQIKPHAKLKSDVLVALQGGMVMVCTLSWETQQHTAGYVLPLYRITFTCTCNTRGQLLIKEDLLPEFFLKKITLKGPYILERFSWRMQDLEVLVNEIKCTSSLFGHHDWREWSNVHFRETSLVSTDHKCSSQFNKSYAISFPWNLMGVVSKIGRSS